MTDFDLEAVKERRAKRSLLTGRRLRESPTLEEWADDTDSLIREVERLRQVIDDLYRAEVDRG
jgi:hypothetical protein